MLNFFRNAAKVIFKIGVVFGFITAVGAAIITAMIFGNSSTNIPIFLGVLVVGCIAVIVGNAFLGTFLAMAEDISVIRERTYNANSQTGGMSGSVAKFQAINQQSAAVNQQSTAINQQSAAVNQQSTVVTQQNAAAPVVLNPWTCHHCGTANDANSDVCKLCGSRRS